MTIPVTVIDANGATAPDYATVRTAYVNAVQSIYGSDIDLDADTQDGEFIDIVARAISDLNLQAVAVYNAFSPVTAQGVGLSGVVKINGIRRQSPSKSTAVVTVSGVVGTPILNGIVGDNLGLGTQWALPASVTIPGAGFVDVTATCTVDGATPASANTLTRILTPTLGWQVVNNVAAGTAGAPVESDAGLRRRQAQSTAIPAQTVLDSIFAALANLPGVTRLSIYENDTDATDTNGVPSHSIAVVIQGGDVMAIAAAIANKKPPGTGTFGTTSEVVIDSRGVPNTIHFFVLSQVTITVEVDIHLLSGYVDATDDAIKTAVAAFISALTVGEDSYLTRLYTPANLGGTPAGDTFVVTAIKQSRSGPPAVADVAIAFNEAAVCVNANVTVVRV